VLLLRGSTEDPHANYVKSREALMALAPPHVPKSENAFEDYKLAGKAYVGFTGAADNNPFWKTNDDSKYFDDPATLTLWSANSNAISLLQKGAQKEKCDWGIDYTVIPWGLTSLVTCRENANLLALDARCRAHKGDHQGAANSLATIRKMARHVDSPPILISSLVSAAMEAISCEALEAILVWDTPHSIGDLASYRDAISQRENPYQRFVRSIELEKVHNLYLLDGIATGAIMPPGWLPSYTVSPLSYGFDRECYEAVANKIVESLRRGEPPEDGPVLIGRYQCGPVPFCNLMVPGTSRSILAVVEIYERALLDDVALALLQFRVKHGRDANTLTELVPEFLPSLPHGAVNNEFVRMRTDVKGAKDTGAYFFADYLEGKPVIRIYTVGPNGKDDGGFRDTVCPIEKDDTIVIIPMPLTETTEQKQK
jgi:hypothetical protein